MKKGQKERYHMLVNHGWNGPFILPWEYEMDGIYYYIWAEWPFFYRS